MSAAVILMAYGSPERLADVPAYYADIRGGRPIRPELLADLVERYRRLGIEHGSPLNTITEETRAALAREVRLPVYTGMKHWHPRIAAAAERALADGARTIVGLVLAPHYSRLSIGGYRRQLEEAIAGRAELCFVESWHDQPRLVGLLAERVLRCLSWFSDDHPGADAEAPERAPGPRRQPVRRAPRDVRSQPPHLVFTAHSLPARILDEGDPYPDQLRETSRLVAERAGQRDWSFSFQSESDTGEPWLQPDILDHLGALRDRGVRDVAVCPVGFVADHLEIRWDIDVEARQRAAELGMRLCRIEMPNADPELVRALAEVVRRALPVPSPT